MLKCIQIIFITFIIQNGLVIGQLRAPPKITLNNGGSLVGSYMHSFSRKLIEAFRGIPYAKPPIGNLRFAPPVPTPAWNGEKLADHDAPPCPQQDQFSDSRDYFGSEDCLYLNVYTPQKRSPNKTLSVMAFFHGGSFVFGGSSSEFYGPERLLDNNIILVTSNYRLGPLGFLSTGSMESPGNNGLKDQVMVLRWIKANIQAFGGNPNDVTIFGHSAGAASVALHLVSPLSKGLFQKAIMQSGNSFDPWAIINRDTAIDRALRIGELLNCSTPDTEYSDMMKCLRDRTTKEIILTTEDFYVVDGEPMNIFGPVMEPTDQPGAFLTIHPKNILDPHGASVPIIIGITTDEGAFKSGPILHYYEAELQADFEEILPSMLMYDDLPIPVIEAISPKINEFYFKNGKKLDKRNPQNLTNMFTDRMFLLGMDEFLRHRLVNRTTASTFVYVFDHRGPMSLSRLYGAGHRFYGVVHGDELPFLFPFGQYHLKGHKHDSKMRWALPKMWSDFAKTGNPTPARSSVTEKWQPATKFPINYAQLGDKYYGKKESHSNSDKFLGAVEEFVQIIESDVDEKLKPEKADEKNGRETKKIIRNEIEDEDAKDRTSRKHSRKHKGKKSHRQHYTIVQNKVGISENRVKFWRNLQSMLELIDEEE